MLAAGAPVEDAVAPVAVSGGTEETAVADVEMVDSSVPATGATSPVATGVGAAAASAGGNGSGVSKSGKGKKKGGKGKR